MNEATQNALSETNRYAAVHDHVLVLRPLPATRTKGGLVLPENAKKPYHYGYVFAAGPKCESVRPGEFVIFEPSNARDVFFDDPDKTCFTVVVEQAIWMRFSADVAKDLGLAMPQLDVIEVFSRTMATALPM